MAEQVSITGTGATLEGRFHLGTAGSGVVLTHPHPLYGGSMDNNVVWTAGRAFEARGWSVLAFNFRGVGQSTGQYGGGLREVEDVAAALSFLKERCPGPHFLVGYSFGAFVAGHSLMQGLAAQGAVFIAPPIAFMDLTFLPRVPGLTLVVTGDEDELCSLTDLQELLQPAPGIEVWVIPGADHFFGGREEALFVVLRDYSLAS